MRWVTTCICASEVVARPAGVSLVPVKIAQDFACCEFAMAYSIRCSLPTPWRGTTQVRATWIWNGLLPTMIKDEQITPFRFGVVGMMIASRGSTIPFFEAVAIICGNCASASRRPLGVATPLISCQNISSDESTIAFGRLLHHRTVRPLRINWKTANCDHG